MMNKFFITVILLSVMVITRSSFADITFTNVNVKTQFLDSPLYRNQVVLTPFVSRASLDDLQPSSTLLVRFFDRNDSIMTEMNLPISAVEFEKCFSSGLSCKLNPISLPFSFERVSCGFELILQSNENTASAKTQRFQWGQCEDLPQTSSVKRPDLKYLDNSLIKNSLPSNYDFQQAISFKIENQGRGKSDVKYKTLVYGTNRNNQVIWANSSDDLFVPAPYAPPQEVISNNPIHNWQWHQLCKLHLVIDSDYLVSEIQKGNNEIDLTFGLCEKIPTNENSLADLIIKSETVNGKAVLFFINQGPLPILESVAPMSFTVDSFNKLGQKISSFEYNLHGDWQGFGDYKKFDLTFIPATACRLSIEVNPHQLIPEISFENNRFDMSLCR